MHWFNSHFSGKCRHWSHFQVLQEHQDRIGYAKNPTLHCTFPQVYKMFVTITVYKRWLKRRWTFAGIQHFTASNISLWTFKNWARAIVGNRNVMTNFQIRFYELIIKLLIYHWISIQSQKRLNKLLSLIIWVSACVMGAVFAIVLMGLVWDRFQTTPTITTVETNNYPIWNVPFPAITICNINKVYAPATKNITEKLWAFCLVFIWISIQFGNSSASYWISELRKA